MTRDRTGGEGDGATIRVLDRLEDLPEPTPRGDFVVVDVIISSTTIVRLLETGVRYVRPFADVEAARSFAAGTDDAFLVGEQDGRAIEGFDSGPLPSVLDSHDLDGRPVGILTSNGTRAVERIGADREIFVGSTINAAAVASVLGERGRDVWVVAAGRNGDATPEDTAGATLVEGHWSGSLTESTVETARRDLRTSDTAAWLRELGFEHELRALLQFDSTDTVPRLRDGVFVAE